jgi:formylglycine-generating enzyme required for sulfatase activity
MLSPGEHIVTRLISRSITKLFSGDLPNDLNFAPLMRSESSTPSEADDLIVRPSTGLVTIPEGGFPALSEIIIRSLAHIQTSRALVVPMFSAGEEREFEIAPGVSIVMCWIPPGEFLMGSPEDEKDRGDDEIQHRVQITKGFWMAKTPTTQALWCSIMGYNPSRFKGDDLPVESVSWHNICGDENRPSGFLNGINLLSVVYQTEDEEDDHMRFRLPTEAQWEYACRAGTTGPNYANLEERAWYDNNCDNQLHSVGRKNPNKWGLHDMLGSVWEWCSDRYGEYPNDAVTDPIGPADPNDLFQNADRVLRGGSWYLDATHCNATSRLSNHPGDKNNGGFGFRIARVLIR